jgi:hypothetical protein
LRGIRQRRSYDIRMHASGASARRVPRAALGLLIVLLNVLGGLFMQPVRLDARMIVVDPALTETARAFGQTIVICTPSGMITIGPDGKPVGPPQGGAHSGLCAFCLPLMAGACSAPAAVADLVYPSATVAFPSGPDRSGTLLTRRRTWKGQPRAPPLV